MLYLRSILLYLFLLAVLLYISKKFVNVRKHSSRDVNRALFAICVIFSVFFGCRWAVGGDYPAYYYEYKSFSSEKWELAFRYLMMFLHQYDLHFSIFFSVVAFLQIAPVLFRIKQYSYALPYILVAFMLGCYWLQYCNVVRSAIASSIIFWGIYYLSEKRLLQYCICIIIACCFHTSAIIALLFIPIAFTQEIFKESKYQLILYLSCVIITFTLDPVLLFETQLENVLPFLRMNESISSSIDYYGNSDLKTGYAFSIGVGFYINLLMAIFLIKKSKLFKKFYKSPYINKLYDLFFIGICFEMLAIHSNLILRLSDMISLWGYVIVGLSLYAFSINDKKYFHVLSFLLVIKFLCIIYKADENFAQFYFFWDDFKPKLSY